MKPEEEARVEIDRMLAKAGWVVQDYKDINLGAARGVAVREFPTKAGPADYLLFVEREATGVVEAKPVGTTLSGVSEQTDKYLRDFPSDYPHVGDPLPFAYESTGVETYFRNLRDPEPRSRLIYTFHRPETLRKWIDEEETLRARMRNLPELDVEGLRDCQVDAIINLEDSFRKAKPRALIQMATGSGKTFAAVTFVYRLIKYAKANRILFLVDRNNLGRQALREFQQYVVPQDGRKFTELYNVQHLTSSTLDPINKVCITTIQRLYCMLQGKEPEEDEEEKSLFEEDENGPPKTISYNQNIPMETFDFIITDECHRSIYNKWRQVLDYFDSFIIGMTATPSKQTLGYFNQNLVTEYSHERAVADGVNVGYDVYRIRTRISEDGSTVEAGQYIDKRDKLTRSRRWELLDEDLSYDSKQLDRDVVAENQVRTVIRCFRESLKTIFPNRKEIPKTLIFAKNDSHAEDIVRIVREEFDKGNEFCKKITYKTTGEKPENLIKHFRMSYQPRIAVSVDMISTGTDIRPLEVLLFMRDIKSRVYFEQMKGRGTRIISSTDLRAVTPDARNKTHFVIVDAVGVCENDKTDSRPLERKKGVAFDKLIQDVANGKRDEDSLTSLANRLARLDRGVDEKERNEIREVSEGKSLKEMVNELLDAVNIEKIKKKAMDAFSTEEPTEDQLKEAEKGLVQIACAPFDSPTIRNKIIEIKQRNEQTIDIISIDEVTEAKFLTEDRATQTIQSFEEFIEENKDEITALQIIYNKPYDTRHLTYEDIKKLAEAIEKPPYLLSTDRLWDAYEKLDKSKVKGAGPQKLLTNIISLVRFALGQEDELHPFNEEVDERFDTWLEEKHQSGEEFTEDQMKWLIMVKDHIASSLSIEKDDFSLEPFVQHGGLLGVWKVFGDDLDKIIDEMNEVLVE
ncbi:MAG: type I restriction endonuclease subunit R [Candidatus Thorarchaeota archaeon]